MRRAAKVLTLAAAVGAAPIAPSSAAEAVLIRGATVHTVSGRTIEGGSVLLRDGRIAAVGRSVDAPDAEVVEAAGQHLYPGLIDCDTVLGLVEIPAVRATRDYSETGEVTPNVRAELAVNPDSELLPVTRANGILYAYTAPRGGRISGMGAVMRLDGWTWADMTVLAPAGLGIQWPRMTIDRRPRARTEPEEQEKQREKALETLRDAFDTARAYLKARDAAAAGEGPPVPVDSRWEAMRPVLSGEVPVVVRADDLTQIDAAVAWAEEQGLRLILAGGEDAWRAADLLAEKEIPVLLGPVLSLPRREWEPYDTAYRNAA
ncbi:MAG: amidohydrolase, partial [Acidobacteriota bacterium]